MTKYMLSTSDNPYNPHTQFDPWYQFDVGAGYNSCAYLDRIIITSDELSESDQEEAIEFAIDEIVAMNLTGNYIKVPDSE